MTDDAAPVRRGFWQRLADISDGAIIRFAFFAMLAGTLSVLWVDYRELTEADALIMSPDAPVLPPARPGAPGEAPDTRVTTAPETLNSPLVIELLPGGVLSLTGTIDVGASQRLADEIAARGEYVQSVSLNSPGGSVTDALAMGALIREGGLDTQVAAGALCASSCPLVFAGGVERLASPEAAIGVHQIYAFIPDNQSLLEQARQGAAAMSDAQTVTATISRYLEEMGVRVTVWLHALETPPDRLYYFTTDELIELSLATSLDAEI